MKKNQTAKTKLKKRPAKKKATTKKTASQRKNDDDFFDFEQPTPVTPGAVVFEMLGRGVKYPNEHRMALVAAIVMRNGDVDEAVKTALKIYDCCHSWLQEADLEAQSEAYSHIGEDDHLYAQTEYSFNDAVRIITDQKRLDRAIQYFSDFGMYSVAMDASCKTPQERLKKIEDRLEFRQTEGFSTEDVIRLKHNFRKYFPKRRKKSLDLQNPL
jgi:hypothetical protein